MICVSKRRHLLPADRARSKTQPELNIPRQRGPSVNGRMCRGWTNRVVDGHGRKRDSRGSGASLQTVSRFDRRPVIACQPVDFRRRQYAATRFSGVNPHLRTGKTDRVVAPKGGQPALRLLTSAEHLGPPPSAWTRSQVTTAGPSESCLNRWIIKARKGEWSNSLPTGEGGSI